MIKLKNLISEAGKRKAKRFTKDLAYDLGNQDLRKPTEFVEYDQLDRKGQLRAWAIWQRNVAMEQ